MVEDELTIVTASVEDGPDVLVEIRMPGGVEEDVADETFQFDRLTESIQAVARRVSAAIEQARPDRAAVEFGVDVGIAQGGLTALIAKGSANATMRVTLVWDRFARGQQQA